MCDSLIGKASYLRQTSATAAKEDKLHIAHAKSTSMNKILIRRNRENGNPVAVKLVSSFTIEVTHIDYVDEYGNAGHCWDDEGHYWSVVE